MQACEESLTLEEKLIQQILEARRQAMDEARPDAVAAVHATGHATARERLTSLLDADSFIEYGVARAFGRGTGWKGGGPA